MWNAFDRAERWRQRAVELRAAADCMSDHAARSSLRTIATALDGHARKIEEMTLKVRCVRRVPIPLRARRQTA